MMITFIARQVGQFTRQVKRWQQTDLGQVAGCPNPVVLLPLQPGIVTLVDAWVVIKGY